MTKLKQDHDHVIVTPIEFHGRVIRKLSDWCSAVPDISIDAELPSLEVQLGPGDYSGILSLVNSLGDGQSTTPPSDKGGNDDGGGKDSVFESKKLPDVKSVELDASSNVKLLLKFQMKQVKPDLNSVCHAQYHCGTFTYRLFFI